MYVRPDGRRKSSEEVSIPRNYSGNAFSKEASHAEEETLPEEIPEAEELPAPTDDAVQVSSRQEKSRGFFRGADSDDLILLGLIFLLSQEGFGDDVIPLLLMILLFRG